MDTEFILKWKLSCERDMAHVVVMPGVTPEMLDNFVSKFANKRLDIGTKMELFSHLVLELILIH